MDGFGALVSGVGAAPLDTVRLGNPAQRSPMCRDSPQEFGLGGWMMALALQEPNSPGAEARRAWDAGVAADTWSDQTDLAPESPTR